MRIKESIYIYIFLSVTALLVGLLYYAAVPMADDYWFMTSSGAETSMSGTLSLILERSHTDVLRLPNQLTPLMLNHMPRWLQAAALGLLCLLTLFGGARLTAGKDNPSGGYVWTALFILCLPWYDYILALSYMMNYLLPSCLTLWTIWYFCRRTYAPVGAARTGVAVFVAFLAGWSHEAFSVPLLGGLLLWMLMDRGRMSGLRHQRRGRRWAIADSNGVRLSMIAAAGAGILLIALSPTFRGRVSGGAGLISRMPMWEFMIQLGPSLLLMSIMLLLVAVRAMRRELSRETLAVAAMSVASETIALMFYSGPRSAWAAELFAITAIAQTIPATRTFRSYVAVAAVCWTAVVCNLSAAVISQRRLTAEFRGVMARYLESADGTVYCDIATPEADLTLFKTTVRQLGERVPRQFIETRYGKPLRILPARLEGYRDGDGQESGTAEWPLRIYRGLVISGKEPDRERQILGMSMGDGSHVESRYRVDGFKSAEGDTLWLLTPHISMLGRRGGAACKIEEVKLTQIEKN